MSGTKRDLVSKERPDKFPSAGDHIHAIPTFEHAWQPQDILLWDFLWDFFHLST